MDKFLSKVVEYGILAFVFLIPWQARLILAPGVLNGGYWEYGTRSLYATELLLFFVFGALVLKGILTLPEKRLSFWRFLSPAGALVLLVLWAGVSIFWSADKSVALAHWTVFMAAAALFFILSAEVVSKKKILGIIFLSAIFQAALGFGQFLAQSVVASAWLGQALQSPYILGSSVIETEVGRWLRAYGSFSHPNLLGGWLVLGLVAGYELWRKGEQKLRMLILLAWPVLIFGLLSTFSRAAWLAGSVFMLVATVLVVSKARVAPSTLGGQAPSPLPKGEGMNRDSPSRLRRGLGGGAWLAHRRIFKLIVITIITTAVFAFLYPNLLQTRLTGQGRLETMSTTERVSSFAQGWAIIKDRPVFGTGIGNYTLALHQKIDSPEPAWFYQPIHNVPLLIWAELGLVGLLISLIFFCWLFKVYGRRLATIFLPLLIIFLFDHYLWSLYSGMMMLSLWMFLLILVKNRQFEP